MSKGIKRFIWLICIAFVLMQLYQPDRNSGTNLSEENDFLFYAEAPDNIRNLILTSCYDCHSYKTVYPWYFKIQPFQMLMSNDIKNGRDNLNFSEWGNYSKRKRTTKIKRMIKAISSNKMPLKMYVLMHSDARIDTNQKRIILNWLGSLQNAQLDSTIESMQNL